MRKIIVLAAIIAGTPALAQSQYYYDGNGNMAGWSNRSGNSTYYYDGRGNQQGWSNNAGGSTYYYDSRGNQRGWSNND